MCQLTPRFAYTFSLNLITVLYSCENWVRVSVTVSYLSFLVILLPLFYLLCFFFLVQRRRWSGWLPCVPSPSCPAHTRRRFAAGASSPRSDGFLSPGSGGRRRARSSSRPQQVGGKVFNIVKKKKKNWFWSGIKGAVKVPGLIHF